MPKIVKIGHRGAAGYEPENTLRSFQKAFDFGVDMVECDVHCTRDGELMVMHDKTVNRTTGGKGAIAKKLLSELKTLSIDENQTIPTLDEVLKIINKQAGINIELKGKNTATAVARLIQNYVNKDGWSYDHFMVSSFDHRQLIDFKQKCPRIKIGVLYHRRPYLLKKIVERFGAYSINLPYHHLNQKLVDNIHAAGLKVFVYTVNKPSDISYVKSLGVDGIISDFPDRL